MSQVVMGALTLALPGHAQLPLQQSQYRVVSPDPETWAEAMDAKPVARARSASDRREADILVLLCVIVVELQGQA